MKVLMFVFSLALLTSCASHEHVRAGADGIHRVVIRAEDKVSAERQALSEAESFCDQYKKMPAFVSEETKYTGSMDEKTHKNIKRVSDMAGVGGGMMAVFGGEKESNVGKGLMGAGAVGNASLDGDAYTSEMKFKCQ